MFTRLVVCDGPTVVVAMFQSFFRPLQLCHKIYASSMCAPFENVNGAKKFNLFVGTPEHLIEIFLSRQYLDWQVSSLCISDFGETFLIRF